MCSHNQPTKKTRKQRGGRTVVVASVGGVGSGGGAGGEPGARAQAEPVYTQPKGMCSRKRIADSSQKLSERSLHVVLRHVLASQVHAGFCRHRSELTRRYLATNKRFFKNERQRCAPQKTNVVCERTSKRVGAHRNALPSHTRAIAVGAKQCNSLPQTMLADKRT